MRYACDEIDRIWLDESVLARWLQVWRAQLAAVGQAHELREMQSLLPAIQARERITGHDVVAALDVIRTNMLAVDKAKWLHYGLCSSDVVDAGWLLGIAEATRELMLLSLRVTDALRELSTKSRGRETLYRTHGQAAQVSDGSARWSGYWSEFSIARGKMLDARPRTVGFNGPTGTGTVLTTAQIEFVMRKLDLLQAPGVNGTGRQASDRTQWSQWLHAVASLATLAERVATMIRLLAIEEVGEVSEGRPDGYVGSSSMPHKSELGRSNPTRSERICGMAAVIRGMSNGYAEAASSIWDSHSLEHSCADRLVIPQVTGLTGFVLTELADVLGTLVINENRVGVNAINARKDRFGADGVDSFTKRSRDLLQD